MSIAKRLWKLFAGNDADTSWLTMPSGSRRAPKQVTERDLIKRESAIGAELFGPVAPGHRREFFCFDADTWIWYEEWLDEKRQMRSTTVRYEVQEKGVLKVQEGARYSYLEGQELQNFMSAIQLYYSRVAREVYNTEPKTPAELVTA